MNSHDAERARTLGIAIATAREQRGMSQTELALVLGYTNNAHLSRIESGQKMPNLPTVFAIADTLGVKVSYFFTEL